MVNPFYRLLFQFFVVEMFHHLRKGSANGKNSHKSLNRFKFERSGRSEANSTQFFQG